MADRELKTDSPTEPRTKRKRRRLRRVGVVVGVLFAGAFINVLVAWGAATAADRRFRGPYPEAAYQRLKRPGNMYTVVFEYQRHLTNFAMFGELSELETMEFEAFHSDSPIPTRWAKSAARDAWPGVDRPAQRYAMASGWPLRSLSYQYLHQNTHPPRGGLVLESTVPKSAHESPLTLPLKLVWPGFVINTVFYGAIVWVLLAAPRALRRHKWAKRNRCADCGYDLRGADHGKCPECGEAVVRKRRQPDSRIAKQGAAE